MGPCGSHRAWMVLTCLMAPAACATPIGGADNDSNSIEDVCIFDYGTRDATCDEVGGSCGTQRDGIGTVEPIEARPAESENLRHIERDFSLRECPQYMMATDAVHVQEELRDAGPASGPAGRI